MLILRCTQKLQKRLKIKAAKTDEASTTVLGDWSCNLVRFGRNQVILCASHRTLMPILLPARDAHSFPQRLSAAVASLLPALGISQEAIEAECKQMADFTFAPTNNRSVLGSLNEFKRMCEWHVESAEAGHLLEVSQRLVDTPCLSLEAVFPDKAIIKAFAEASQV